VPKKEANLEKTAVFELKTRKNGDFETKCPFWGFKNTKNGKC